MCFVNAWATALDMAEPAKTLLTEGYIQRIIYINSLLFIYYLLNLFIIYLFIIYLLF